MAVFDATALLLLLDPDAKPPLDPGTEQPIADAKARIEFLIRTLDERRETVIIPTPALSEVLVHAGDAGPGYLGLLSTTRCFRIEPFDQRAAVELAAMTRDAISAGDLRAGADMTRAKLKFDRQIVAIARTLSETTVYSDDRHIAKIGGLLGLKVIPSHALPLPTPDPQFALALPPTGKG